MAKIRVLLVDDHAVLRAGLRLLLTAQPDMEVVGEAADRREAMIRAQETRPDVITLDLTMPGGGSITLIERLRAECPSARVVALTMHDDPAYVRAVLAAGGSGYVVKTAADMELLSAIRSAYQGRIFVNVQLPDNLARESASKKTGGASLSGREREVLTLLAQGHTNQEIADRLFRSVKTIETYRSRITTKLGLRTRAEIVRYVHGLNLPGTVIDRAIQP